MGTIILN